MCATARLPTREPEWIPSRACCGAEVDIEKGLFQISSSRLKRFPVETWGQARQTERLGGRQCARRKCPPRGTANSLLAARAECHPSGSLPWVATQPTTCACACMMHGKPVSEEDSCAEVCWELKRFQTASGQGHLDGLRRFPANTVPWPLALTDTGDR